MNRLINAGRILLFQQKRLNPGITVAEFHRRTSSNDERFSNKRYLKKKESFSSSNSSGVYGAALVLSSIFAIYLYEKWNSNKERRLSLPKNVTTTLCKAIPNDNLPNDNETKGKYSPFIQGNVIADIAEQASPSVAYIEALQKCASPFAPMSMVSVSSGSGFLVDDENNNSGIILTNAHVIANCQQVIVRFNDDRSIKGQVEFIDERLDLATVRVPLSEVKHLKPIKLLDNSRKIRPGEWVIAVGAPFTLSNTVTVGVVSSISRAGRDLGISEPIQYIQTDASINIGNSGGPLLNLEGEAIGITTLKVGEGVAFAIPASYARNFLKQCSSLRNNKSIDQSTNYRRSNKFDPTTMNKPKLYIGFTIVTLTEPLMESYRRHGIMDHHSYDKDLDLRSGVMVYRVVQGSPAHLGGLKNGDIIVAINGQPISTAEEVYKILQQDNQQQQQKSIEMEFQIKRDHEQDMKLKIHPQIILDH